MWDPVGESKIRKTVKVEERVTRGRERIIY